MPQFVSWLGRCHNRSKTEVLHCDSSFKQYLDSHRNADASGALGGLCHVFDASCQSLCSTSIRVGMYLAAAPIMTKIEDRPRRDHASD